MSETVIRLRPEELKTGRFLPRDIRVGDIVTWSMGNKNSKTGVVEDISLPRGRIFIMYEKRPTLCHRITERIKGVRWQ